MHVVILSFFFSSRRRHTRYWRDWSSDVCSSDLAQRLGNAGRGARDQHAAHHAGVGGAQRIGGLHQVLARAAHGDGHHQRDRSEEHTSELQSRQYLVCRLLLEKKKKTKEYTTNR